MTVAVLGGHGKTGRAVVAALARREVAARALGRADRDDLAGAVAGCDSVYVIAPNLHPDEPRYVGEAVAAAREAGVARVVYHSVAAPYAPSMPHHLGKAHSEDLVRRSGLDWTVLQPCAYVQNFLPGLSAAEPGVRVPYSVDAGFGLVDLADVAEAAATVLTDTGHIGATYELGGPTLATVGDVAATASDVLGRPVPAERIDPDAWAADVASGMDPRERDWLLAMFGYYDRHGLPTGPLPLQALLGRPATSLRDTLRRELTG